MKKITAFPVFYALLLITCDNSFAAQHYSQQLSSVSPLTKDDEVTKLNHPFKLKPRFNVLGVTGSNTLGKGQAVIPLYGDQRSALFGLIEAGSMLHGNEWFSGVGLGYRRVIDDNQIYGGYLTTSYNHSANNYGSLVINPGAEILGEMWDLNINAYFPSGKKRQIYATTKWGEDFGVSDYVQYEGHRSYDRYMQRQDFISVGKGMDFKIGRRLPCFDDAKIYLGGYHFSLQDAGKINGALVKFTYAVNQHTAFELLHTYDNYNRHRTLFGVRLTLGGHSRDEQREFGIASRLTDFIDHGYVAGITTVPTRAVTGVPRLVDEERRLRYDNLWFISGSGGDHQARAGGEYYGDGSYEHPFSNFNPAVLHYIANYGAGRVTKYPMLYFAPGVYNLAEFSGVGKVAGKLLLPTGWGMYGRDEGYVHRAYGAGRPILVGGVDLAPQQGNAGGDNTIDSLVLRETGDMLGCGEGVLSMFDVQNVSLSNTRVGADDLKAGGYYTAVYMNNSRANFSDVDIYGYNDSSNDTSSYGIYALNSAIDFVGGKNKISVFNSREGQSAVGVALFECSVLNFHAGVNEINAVSFANGFPLSPAAYGITAGGKTSINLQGGETTITALNRSSGLSPTATAIGVAVHEGAEINFFGGKNHIVSNAVIGDDAAGEYFMANSVAVESGDGATVNFCGGDNVLDALSFSRGGLSTSDSIGLIALEDSSINFRGGINVINATSTATGVVPHAYSIGVKADDGAQLNFLCGTNTVNSIAKFITVNGMFSGSQAIGIDLYNEATLNFGGGTNNVSAIAAGDGGEVAYGMSYDTFGIRSYGAHINFTDGDNNVRATSAISGGVDPLAKVYGLAAYMTDVNFAKKEFDAGKKLLNVNVEISINGAAKSRVDGPRSVYGDVYGVYADQDAHLSVGGVELDAEHLTSLLDYVAISRSVGWYPGSKVEWEGVGHVSWD